MNRLTASIAGVVATGALWSADAASRPSPPWGVPRPSVCEFDPDDPAAAVAVLELVRYLGDLDDLCGAGFVDMLREIAGGLPDETVDPASLVPDDPVVTPTESSPPPTTVGQLVAEPAIAGIEEMVAAGVVAPGPELDALSAAVTAFCSAPTDGADALIAASAPLEGGVDGWTPNRVAIALVGEQCAPAVDALIGELDFSRSRA